MAVIYLSSVDGSDVDDGSTWALAKATMAAALTAAGAGGTVYVDSAHAESATGTKTLASPGTAASPVFVLSVDRTGNPEPPTAVLAGASVATTTSTPTIVITGYSYWYGITFRPGNAATSGVFNLTVSAIGHNDFDTCTFISAGSPSWNICANTGVTGADCDFINCTFDTTTDLNVGSGQIRFLGGSWANNFPTTPFQPVANRYQNLLISGMDLSGFGSGKNLVDVAAGAGNVRIENCKLGSSVSLTTGTAILPGQIVTLVNSDSADTNYRYHESSYAGDITHETTIVRTGGASDGTTTISRKFVSSANTKFHQPLTYDIMFFNNGTSQLDLACEVVSDNVTFTNAELWLEVEALTTSGFPKSAFTSDRISTYLTTAANQTSSSVTWTTTGLTTPVKQKLEVSVTPAEKGWIRCRIMLAKASSTVYVCPLITGLGFTSGRQWQARHAYVIEGAGGGTTTAHIIGG